MRNEHPSGCACFDGFNRITVIDMPCLLFIQMNRFASVETNIKLVLLAYSGDCAEVAFMDSLLRLEFADLDTVAGSLAAAELPCSGESASLASNSEKEKNHVFDLP